MRRRTTHFHLSTLFLLSAVAAVVFGCGRFAQQTGGSFIGASLLALLFIFVVASTTYLVCFCVQDSLGHRIAAPKDRSHVAPRIAPPGDQTGCDQREELAAAQNQARQRWWKRTWPNRYRAYGPGRDFTIDIRPDA